MILLEYDMAEPCKGLIDSHIEQIHMKTHPLDCEKLHYKILLK